MKIPNTTPLARLALALAVSPLVAASLLDLWTLIVDITPALRSYSMPMKGTIGLSYLVVVCCGLPMAGLFALFRLAQWWHYALAGLVVGAGVMVLGYQLIALGPVPPSGGDEVYQPIDWGRTLIIGFFASITALAFWWLRYGELRRFNLLAAFGERRT